MYIRSGKFINNLKQRIEPIILRNNLHQPVSSRRRGEGRRGSDTRRRIPTPNVNSGAKSIATSRTVISSTEEDKEAARRRRQEIENPEKWPRVRGLTKEEGGSGDGDDFITFETNDDEDGLSGDESSKKKQKKRKAKGTTAEKPKITIKVK